MVPALDTTVAKSLVEDYIGSHIGISAGAKPALFWKEGKFSLDEVTKMFQIDILQAKENQKRWFINLSTLADDRWQRTQKHTEISSMQRKAADLIGWTAKEHPWMSPLTTMKSKACPACGLSYPEGQVICSACKCVLDKNKYEELQFA